MYPQIIKDRENVEQQKFKTCFPHIIIYFSLLNEKKQIYYHDLWTAFQYQNKLAFGYKKPFYL